MTRDDAYLVLATIAEMDVAAHRVATAPNRYARLAAQAQHKNAHTRLFARGDVQTWSLLLDDDDVYVVEHVRQLANEAIAPSDND